ncbi:sulfotransferase [Asticcacaulis sp.]|uniref:sulfotransferase n=1 Tax=Asticcacaulis sp. TaxID=1872648 RepID=UPI002631627C|nr:sulfotransferase [Asticcacaulis sp.]
MQSPVHVISGLPRSGSTLLSALLLQNPRFHAGISSPVLPLMTNLIDMMSAGGGPVMVTDEQRRSIVKGVFDGFYASTGREVVFDTNRAWTARLPLLQDLFPGAKVIACVRDMPWIMDSFERVIRQSPYEKTRMFAGAPDHTTVYGRTEALGSQNGVVGGPWCALREAYYGPQSQSLLIVEYELLAHSPEKVLRLVYDFIGEPWYSRHDFENVEFNADDFDAALGLRGLHAVRPRVAFEPRKTILPPDVWKRYEDKSFWRDPAGSAAHVIAARGKDTTKSIQVTER